MKRIMKLGVTALFLASILSFAIPVLAEPQTAYLFAGKSDPESDIPVGTVTVWNDANNLYVTYKLTTGWKITETHLYVDNQEPIKFAPGRLPYKKDHDPPVNTYTYSISLGDWEPDDEIWIAAHAVVWNPCTGQEETAWAWAECHSKALPKKWGWYFYYEVQ